MEGIQIALQGWEDGQPVTKKLEVTDRWEIHAANEVTVCIADVSVRIKQLPNALNASRLGVGACLWEGELLLANYLGHQPQHKFMGSRVVELGSGPGLIGLLLAKLGAKVVITDIPKVLPLIEENVALNGLDTASKHGKETGTVEVEELEWGVEGYMARVQALASTPIDYVLAADCCYIDNEGVSPSTEHFIRACHGLCSSNTKCLVSFELRSKQVKSTFLSEATKIFSSIERIPKSALPKGCQVEHIELYELKK